VEELMLRPLYGVKCHDCGETMTGTLQYDGFICNKCKRVVYLCTACRADRICRSCKKGDLLSEAERMEKLYGKGFIF
jgi:hypothetical protein